jgi:hypothetical protein
MTRQCEVIPAGDVVVITSPGCTEARPEKNPAPCPA